jgi:hypothetical protein
LSHKKWIFLYISQALTIEVKFSTTARQQKYSSLQVPAQFSKQYNNLFDHNIKNFAAKTNMVFNPAFYKPGTYGSAIL